MGFIVVLLIFFIENDEIGYYGYVVIDYYKIDDYFGMLKDL